jgi:hypothetical protein
MFKSLLRDFGIKEIKAYKVALTLEQVENLIWPPSMEAKVESPTYRAFVERFGITDAYELVHRLISGRHTAVGDLADFQGASDEHTLIRT